MPSLSTVTGVYVHYIQGFETSQEETWVLSGDAFSLSFRYCWQSRLIHGAVQLQADRITDFQYQINEDDVLLVAGRYHLEKTRIQVKRTLFSPVESELIDSIPYTGDLTFDPPFVSTKGYTILRLAGKIQKPVFAPHLTAGDRAGDMAKKSATFIADETIEIDGKQFAAKRYHYMRDYWLDEHGVVLKARDDAQDYEIVLTEYQRNP